MKYIYQVVLCLSFLVSSILGSEVPEPWLTVHEYDEELPGTPLTYSQRDGIYIPAWGTFKVLVVFVKMKDDTKPSAAWPLSQDPD